VATYFILEVTVETDASSADYRVEEVGLDGTVIEDNKPDHRICWLSI
jgi:hypothetical protein